MLMSPPTAVTKAMIVPTCSAVRLSPNATSTAIAASMTAMMELTMVTGSRFMFMAVSSTSEHLREQRAVV
jgi:hypothetical protein